MMIGKELQLEGLGQGEMAVVCVTFCFFVLLDVYRGRAAWPEGLTDEEDDWWELQQLEGLGQGGALSLVLFFVLLCYWVCMEVLFHGLRAS
jgi:hypothetical protein